jgi:hypothetical protein
MANAAQALPNASNSGQDGEDWEKDLMGTADKGEDQKDVSGGEKPKEPVPEDHPTKLGRRVSKMEEMMSGFLDRFDSFMVKMEEQRQVPRATTQREPEEDEVPDHIREAAEYVERRQAKREQARLAAQQTYSKAYLRAVRKGFEEDIEEDLHKEIVKELTETNYQNYMKHSGEPEEDARLNYGLAMATVLKRQRSGVRKPPNVRGDKEHAPTEVSSSTHIGEVPKKEVELDEFSSKFLNSLDPKEAQALREGLQK